MSFGTPQRVINLRKEHERSVRALNSTNIEKFNDSLDAGDETFVNFSGFQSSVKGRTATKHGQRGNSPSGRVGFTPGMIDISEKDATIARLQDEIERLRSKVNSVVESAESSLQEAIEAQEALRTSFNVKLDKKEQEVEHIRVENIVLKGQVASLRAELAVEREQVAKGLRFVDRIKSNPRVKSALDKNIFKQHVTQY
jgi:hypothetical protein